MSKDTQPSRRSFMRLCASALAMVSATPRLLAGRDAMLRRYARVRLVDSHNHPIAPGRFAAGESYVFHYPYLATPCFLIDLGQPVDGGGSLRTEDGGEYRWPGGIGPGRSIVAFSAICAHRMSHPAQEVSFISYRHRNVAFSDTTQHRAERSRVIFCCSERSVYDPLHGARVLGGPAPQPLAAILLEQDEDGTLCATGTCGGELFERFFREFGSRLVLEFGTENIRAPVTGTSLLQPLAEFSQNVIRC